jgi:hypothetical protein
MAYFYDVPPDMPLRMLRPSLWRQKNVLLFVTQNLGFLSPWA